jgi:hypothetical protein
MKKSQVAERKWHNDFVHEERGADSGSQAQIEHPAAFVTA